MLWARIRKKEIKDWDWWEELGNALLFHLLKKKKTGRDQNVNILKILGDQSISICYYSYYFSELKNFLSENKLTFLNISNFHFKKGKNQRETVSRKLINTQANIHAQE